MLKTYFSSRQCMSLEVNGCGIFQLYLDCDNFIRLYIGCDTCSRWFHASCVGVSATDLQLMTAYVCPECRNHSTVSSHLLHAAANANTRWMASSTLLKHLEVCLLIVHVNWMMMMMMMKMLICWYLNYLDGGVIVRFFGLHVQSHRRN